MVSVQTARKELNWYYNQAHADLGICSSFGSMIQASFGFTTNASVNTVEDKMLHIASQTRSPIARLRRTEHALHALSKPTRRAIDALYGNYNYPVQLVSVFGERTGLALFFSPTITLTTLIRLCHAKLANLPITPEERSTIARIELHTRKLYEEIHLSYAKARDLQ